MKEKQFSITINAPKETVWKVLWDDTTLREWAGIVDPGTYMLGDMREGKELQFISGNGYGVTSLVEKLIVGEYLMLRHQADTQDQGANERDKEWTGGAESYELSESNGMTTLKTVFDVPTELENYFDKQYPLALAKIKQLAESI